MKREEGRGFPALIVLLLAGTMLLLAGCMQFNGTASFTAVPTSGQKPLTVQFTPIAEGAVQQWIWNFGDGSTSTEREPEHIYDEVGSYTVLLTIVPRGADAVTIKKEEYIVVTGGLTGPPRPQ